MIIKIDSSVIIGNIFYAKQVNYINYEEIEEYKRNLYKILNQKYKYIMFDGEKNNILKIEEKTFIKDSEGIRCLVELDENFIKKLNSIYPEDVQKMIKVSRNKYNEKNKQLIKRHV